MPRLTLVIHAIKAVPPVVALPHLTVQVVRLDSSPKTHVMQPVLQVHLVRLTLVLHVILPALHVMDYLQHLVSVATLDTFLITLASLNVLMEPFQMGNQTLAIPVIRLVQPVQDPIRMIA